MYLITKIITKILLKYDVNQPHSGYGKNIEFFGENK